MKFGLDHDVPDDLTYLLRELNHELIRLRNVLPPQAGDAAVLDCAVVNVAVRLEATPVLPGLRFGR